jgi:hypothetical protein
MRMKEVKAFGTHAAGKQLEQLIIKRRAARCENRNSFATATCTPSATNGATPLLKSATLRRQADRFVIDMKTLKYSGMINPFSSGLNTGTNPLNTNP